MSPTPQLIQVADFRRAEGGSFAALLAGLLAAARDRGWERRLIINEEARGTAWVCELESLARIHYAPARIQSSRRARARWLAAELRRLDGPLVVHTHFTTWDVAAIAATMAPGVPDSRLFWHAHSALAHSPMMVARSVVKFGLLGRRVSGIICPAPNIALAVAQRLAPGRIYFVPSALDLERFPRQSAADRESAREELGIDPDAIVLLHFGWHTYLKGTDLFLRTVRALRDSGTPVIGLVRGHGPDAPGIATALGLDEAVRFQEPVESASMLFAAADMQVSSSREEGMAYTVLEALASGTPVVATAIPGHSFIAEHVAACRITRRDPEALADSVRAVLALSEPERAAEASEARDWIGRELSVDRIAERTFEIYEAGLNPPGAGAPTSRRPGWSESAATTQEPSETGVRLIQLPSFASPTPGSFIPMLEAACEVARERGWTPEVMLPEAVAGHQWVEDLEERVRFLPELGRDGERRWLEEVVAESPGRAILHSHFTNFDVPAALARLGESNGVVVWHIHSTLSRRPVIVLRNLLKFGILGRTVGAIVCPSPDLPPRVRRRLAPASRLRFVPNGIDCERFDLVTADSRRAAREALGVPPDAEVLLGFAWSWRTKGGDRLVRAVAELAPSRPGLLALVVTRDPKAASLVAELGVERNVRILDPTPDVSRLYSAADIFVSASRDEGGTPFAVLEALCSGLPVVATDIGGQRFIAERVSGCTLASGDGIATAVGRLLDVDPSERERRGRADRKVIEQVFSLTRWKREMASVYEAALDR